MKSNDPLVGSFSSHRIEQVHETCLVRIAPRTVTIWLNPFRMLNAQVFMDLPLKFGVRMNFVRHDYFLSKGSSRKAVAVRSQAIVGRSWQLLRLRGIFDCYSGGDPRSLFRGRTQLEEEAPDATVSSKARSTSQLRPTSDLLVTTNCTISLLPIGRSLLRSAV